MPPCCTAIPWHPLETQLGALQRSAFCLARMLLATFWTFFIFTKHLGSTEVLFHLGLGFEFCIALFLHWFNSELVNLNVFERAVHTGLHLTLYCSFCISMKGGFSPTLKSSFSSCLKHEWLLLFVPPNNKIIPLQHNYIEVPLKPRTVTSVIITTVLQ